MNALLVAYKPPFISSNAYLGQLKRRYKEKKAGFSGTLDPFACGTLVVAFGAYTKLFRFLKKYPKRYRATLWLGAASRTLDIEGIERIDEIEPIETQKILEAIRNLQGTITYTPPKFSAKKIKGRRAYQLAHEGTHIELAPVTSTIYDIRLIAYRHPFITFEAQVSEGTYIRSVAELIAKALGVQGSLSYLERLQEGAFSFQNERFLDPLDYLISRPNETDLKASAIWQGKPIRIEDLAIKEDGLYHLVFEEFFAIIQIRSGKVRYLLNRIPRS